MSDVILSASGVSKSFGGVHAVENVSIAVEQGTIHAVIGPNGAGKTTFFNTLSGYYFPDAGNVVFRGHDVTREANWKRILLGMSRTFQTPSIFRDLTVGENLMIGVQAQENVAFSMRVPNAARRSQLEERVDELLGFVNLGRVKDRPVAELSHGSQRLCEIALSLSTNPVMVLLDEPMAGLAEAESARVIGVVRDLRDRLGLTVLFVEHNMRVVLSVAEKITVLDRGAMLAEGNPAEISGNEAVREAYLGREIIQHV
ncbi:MAG: ABC transporter ATP-binding protein [Candidatus Eremiobacteraeota bacterium]|nr:ABC transporter ATP-binding protein [Candidatus Eremiobacteraeota bacterium]MBV8355766.1 ABC transporter ATP-binding protein [Candidatus Eremiobacteraeota bacterium]